MSVPKIPQKAKLFIGILYGEDDLLIAIEKVLVKKFGDIDLNVKDIPFVHTEYYKEMGEGIKKAFFSFKKLIDRESIADIKIFTNKLEKQFTTGDKRRVNIDPGYLILSNVFLATCKMYYHRTYLKKGIYLENEYFYTDKHFEFWDWTYPDYKKKQYLDFFYETRKIYWEQLKKLNTPV
ncbi:DUF4416 family protein [Spirochaetota bacterium]